jgi:hypothetical protein
MRPLEAQENVVKEHVMQHPGVTQATMTPGEENWRG